MTAGLIFAGTCYVCHGADVSVRAFPCTPVFSLIWGIYEERQERAFEAVRRPIVTSTPITDFCRATVKVGAKRLREGNPLEHAVNDTVAVPAWPQCTEKFFGTTAPEQPIVLADDASISAALAARVEAIREMQMARLQQLYTRNRAVCALLLDANGNVLLEAANTNAVNRLRHAETNLVLGWWERNEVPFPEGARVAVSLKPCRMCAAMLLRASTRVVPIVYLEDDPGPLACSTAYDAVGLPLRKLR